jgi:DNA-binding transcriptional ArsR family regulator
MNLQSTDALFHALADPTRRRLLERLMAGGAANVAALTEVVGVSQPAVSKHLSILKNADLVTGRPNGRQTYYSASPSALRPLRDWVETYAAFWDLHLDKLEDTLRRMDQ